jgi:hypothetical protein
VSKRLAKLLVLGVVGLAALGAAGNAAAFNRNLACTFGPNSSGIPGGNTTCTYDSAYYQTVQYRCSGGVFSSRVGEHWATVTWVFRGNFAAKLDGVYPSGALSVQPGLAILGTSIQTFQTWNEWEYANAETSASLCAEGDFLIGSPD